MPETTPNSARSRAKKACKACNARRVRCDVTEHQPCTNCINSEVPCELVASRRGKYDRQARKVGVRANKNGTKHNESVGDHSEGELKQTNAEKSYNHAYNGIETPSQAPPQSIIDAPTGSIFTQSSSSANTPSAIAASVNADSTVYLGESSSISVVHGQQSSHPQNHHSPLDKSKLRYPIPDSVHAIASTTPQEARRRVARVEQLTREGTFSFPPDRVCEVLLKEYFQWFHPCFPVLDRATFSQNYSSKTVSPLLLQAVLFIGSTHCKPRVLANVGETDRQDLRSTLYHKAKDLYDADYETDKIVVTQALFLMSFWRAGPTLEKDTRHWLGAAISLAQSKGMHRSSPTAVLFDRRLRKKIWWCLYIRDRQCAAALGLPTRIRDEDCDIELLCESDFDSEPSASIIPACFGIQRREHVLYICHMAKLATLLGKIVLREFSPGTSPYTNTDKYKLQEMLEQWESELSIEMNSNATSGSFLASTLHIAHNNLYILLYRSDYLKEQEDSDKGDGMLALEAACRNTRIVEDMLSVDQCGNGNLHMITSLFNSLCIHTIHLRRSENTARKLAEYRAQLCLLGLRELQKTWDVSNWVLQLFFQFLEQSTAQKLKTIYTDRDESATENKSVNASSNPQALAHDANTPLNFPTPGVTPLDGFPLTTPVNGQPNDLVSNIHFESSHLFGTREAEDFSMFQLQPDLFHGDLFGGGLDEYYSSVFPRDGINDNMNLGR